MVNGVSGSNLVTSMRELDHATPQTQQQALNSSAAIVQQSLVQAKTDTVTFSKYALDKSKKAEKFREEAAEHAERPEPKKPGGKQ